MSAFELAGCFSLLDYAAFLCPIFTPLLLLVPGSKENLVERMLMLSEPSSPLKFKATWLLMWPSALLTGVFCHCRTG